MIGASPAFPAPRHATTLITVGLYTSPPELIPDRYCIEILTGTDRFPCRAIRCSLSSVAMDDQFEGGGLCGAARFMATGQPKWVAWCHCQSCRRDSGAPVSVLAAFALAAYVVTKGEITKFGSSPGVYRGFCARCGSTLTCESDRLPLKHIFTSEPSIKRPGFGRRGTYSRRNACRG